MPKAEKGSIKDLNKRMKMKGLQKLKYYCQICEKQCRDANGFKCHLTSNNHLQQISIFSKNASTRLDQYSTQFQKHFIDTLRMRHSTSKVLANTVYQEMIQDKFHIHMNATIWTTLTDFVKYLGKHGYCMVEETERGWYITYIERNVQKLQQIEQQQLRIQAEQHAEYEMNTRIEQQQRHAAVLLEQQQQQQGQGTVNVEPTKLGVSSSAVGIPPIQLTLKNTSILTTTKKKSGTILPQKISKKSVFDDDDDNDDDDENDNDQDVNKNANDFNPAADDDDNNNNNKTCLPTAASTGVSSVETTISMVQSKHQDDTRKSVTTNKTSSTGTDNKVEMSQSSSSQQEPWLLPNIMVRIITKQFIINNINYYRYIGIVDSIVPNDPYIANIRIIPKHHNETTTATTTTTTTNKIKPMIVQFDQEDLETVGPKQIPEHVCIVRGTYRGQYGIVTQYNKKEYQATIEIQNVNNQSTFTGMNGRSNNSTTVTLHNVDYDDFSKLA